MRTQPMQIRLALREEGGWWNAYLAQVGTMDGAKLIGSIAIGAAKKSPAVKAAFQDLMQQVVANGVEEITGEAPTEWNIGPAPEAERAGHG
jgi:hypothetical protein